MLRRILLSTLMVAWAVGAGAAPAPAARQRPCVSRQEYRDVQVGWRQASVAAHFGVSGRKIGARGWYRTAAGQTGVDTVWMYRKCSAWAPGGGSVGVGYANHGNGYPDQYLRTWGKVASRPERLLAGFGGPPPRVQPDGARPCVTRREYRDVRWGWRMSRVADHFDTRGVHIGHQSFDYYTDSVWKYRKCSAWGPGGRYVAIIYNNYDFSPDEEAGAILRLMIKQPDRPARLVDAVFGRNGLYE